MFSRQFWRFIVCLSLLTIEAGWGHGQDLTNVATLKVSDIRNRYLKERDDLKELSVKWVQKFELQIDPKVAVQINRTTDYLITEVHAAFKGSKLFYDQKYSTISGKPRHSSFR